MKTLRKRSKKDLKGGKHQKRFCLSKLHSVYFFFFYNYFNRQAATKKQLEQLRIDDANIDGIIDANDSIFNTNLQNSLALGESDKNPTETTNQGN